MAKEAFSIDSLSMKHSICALPGLINTVNPKQYRS
jgi:hypothetical protein